MTPSGHAFLTGTQQYPVQGPLLVAKKPQGYSSVNSKVAIRRQIVGNAVGKSFLSGVIEVWEECREDLQRAFPAGCLPCWPRWTLLLASGADCDSLEAV